MYCVYILYSVSRNKYYVGSCQDIDRRLKKHNTNHAGFTGGAADWIVKWIEQHQSKGEALQQRNRLKTGKAG